MNEIERSLQEKSKRLTEREIEVVGRELKQILEQNEQKNFQRNKSINRKKDGRPPLISYPKDFCHNVTVMKTSLEHSSQPSLQAKTLNKTWTPGTKIRRELHTDLFVNVSRTSSMSQDTDCADVECYQQQQQSSSVSSSKMKKIGRFLKRIFGHNDDNDHSLLNDNNHRPHEQRSIFHIDSEDNIVDNDTNALIFI
ncbi:hypothetical protein DERP_012438 [Dermatophagoides pteronyssinus]|uniref:Uncharacterized protein n=1 Tax=Dermatophagoides pteronyssinus TaxID=6956 RepID=A0ABQ8IWZ4_DERPT|nr:hypothetical protein DERP_012438 [Dermatophagoides pteronyssinus]